MKILLLYTQQPYPPHSGGRIRRWEILKFLAQRYEVTLVCFGDSHTADSPAQVRALCHRVIVVKQPSTLSPEDLALGMNLPAPAKPYCTTTMAQAIQALSPHTFDLVLVDTLYMSVYRDLLPGQTVLLEQNVESQLYKQYENAQSEISPASDKTIWRVMALYENRMWNTFPLRVTVSSTDTQEMDRRCRTGRTITIENGVDLATHPLLPSSQERTLILTGAFDYFPNLDAAYFLHAEILPRIWHAAPDVRVILAGSHPPQQLVDLFCDSRLCVIANPVEMESIARRASIAIVPLRLGSGTRLKILEAFAWGLPVVTTSLGCSGLQVEDGHDLLVHNEPETIAAAVLRLWTEPDLFLSIQKNARRRVEQTYDWSPILERMDAEFRALAQTRIH